MQSTQFITLNYIHRYAKLLLKFATGHSNCLDRVENNKVGASKCVYCTLMTSYQS